SRLKLSPRKTSRPPLTQARFDPRSRITGRPPTNGPGCSGSNGISRRQHPHRRRLLPDAQAEKTVILCPCCWQASIFWNGTKKDPISHRPAPPINLRWTRARGRGGASGSFLPFEPLLSRLDGTLSMTSLDSFRCCRPLKVGSRTYAY